MGENEVTLNTTGSAPAAVPIREHFPQPDVLHGMSMWVIDSEFGTRRTRQRQYGNIARNSAHQSNLPFKCLLVLKNLDALH